MFLISFRLLAVRRCSAGVSEAALPIALVLMPACLAAIAAGEPVTEKPIPVSEAARHVTLPPGFEMTLFAGEPDVHQPIALTFDDRGRLWVAEFNTYGDKNVNFDTNFHDRILIFEDNKGDGHFDKCKVFWDQAQKLTSIALGFGGVFATCAPNLIFIPDRNGDDIPDGPPEVLLDGWNDNTIRHNIVNGLKWGPDGWLYGRHGIQATSSVGKPGTPDSARTKLNCAIWRYHPTKKVFEVVCQGGTNPWGHDWDQYGELFFINTVIGHLWQGFPGAYYKRMYGEHLAPYRYDLIDQAADHYHWDTGRKWSDPSNAGAGADVLGGGHAHSGLMIYQGGNWPAPYQNRLFTLNFHGRGINQERLDPGDSGTVAKHEPDFVKFEDPWFRGIDLDYGPDGGVYILDWSDTGECHENDADGVHRETGRIYKLTYAEATGSKHDTVEGPAPLSLLAHSLAGLSNPELLRLQLHPNEWFARHARRILQERAPADPDPQALRQQITAWYDTQTNIPHKLRLMFALHSVGGDSESWLETQLRYPDDHIRCWAVRFLAESALKWEQLLPLFTALAATDPSPKVRLSLASALQRAPPELREALAAALLRHGEDATDHNLPLMLWYGIEPVAAQHPAAAIRLAEQSRIPIVREYIARRLAEDLETKPQPVEALVQMATRANAADQADVLRGLAQALRGWRKAPKPAAWDTLQAAMAKSGNQQVYSLVRDLSVVFGDGRALDELRQIALDSKTDPESRRAALRQVIDARPSDLETLLSKLLLDRATVGVAARGLLLFDDPEIPRQVFKRWDTLQPQDRAAVVGLMASRASYAGPLLDAVAQNLIPRSALTAFQARQIRNFNKEELTRRLAEVWGEVRTTSADKSRLMAQYRALLTPARLKQAELPRGREVFSEVCAVCHRLFGEGAAIGPDLTGGGRASLDYLLENIVDPNAIVPADYHVSDVELKDDRSFTALVVSKNEGTLTLQTPTERFTVDRKDIASIRETTLSLMPEGLLQGLKEQQICNLIAYLMTPNQVPLPAATGAQK